jgi:hypothetical protein
MEIRSGNHVRSLEGVETGSTQEPASNTGPTEENVRFDQVLAQAQAENLMQEKPVVVPRSSEASLPSPVSVPSAYGLGQGPGYGKGATPDSPGTPGYGGDSSPSPDGFHSMRGMDTGARRYGFARGPGYGSGTSLDSPGTPGYGSDASPSPDDLLNSIRGAESIVGSYAFAKGPGYGSGIGTAGYASDSSPEEIGNGLNTSTRSGESPEDAKTRESDH